MDEYEHTAAAAHSGRGARLIDLTHTAYPGIPVWPGDHGFTMECGERDAEGFLQYTLQLGEHTGTHVDAPAHAVPGGATVDTLPSSGFVLPITVIDAPLPAAPGPGGSPGPDAVLTPRDLVRWERAHGPVPAGALVALRTGSGPNALADPAGLHWPGFSAAAITRLIEHNAITAIGTDAPSIDCGDSELLPAHRAILGSGRYAVEMLAGLERLPASGATVIVAPWKLADGSGAPARVFAILPED